MNKNLNYITLFSSSGIGCYGFQQNYFKCIATVELLNKRLEIQKANNKCSFQNGYICEDITLESTKQKIYNNISSQNISKIDVIIATPPCQGMSVANHHKNDKSHKKNSLVIESIDLVKNIRPNFFVFENVKTFLNTTCTLRSENMPISEAIDKELSLFYDIESRVINFKDYGSNSSRTRTLVIGSLKNLNIEPFLLFPSKSTVKNLKQVLKNLPKIDTIDKFHTTRILKGKYLEWVSNTPEGKSAFNNVKKEHRPHKIIDGNYIQNKKSNLDKYKRCEWGKVAPCVHTRNDTISSQNTIHPTENRVFSIRELSLMMNIPSTFVFVGSEQTIRASIGEAVPTNIFYQIAKNISSYS